MKKIYSIIAAALFCATMNAQTLNEGFEGEDFPPAGWSVTNTSTVGWMSGVKGSACAKVAGTYGTESYLITPMLKPASGEKLTFSACIGGYASKGQLRVEVSLGSTDVASFEVVETYYTSRNAESNGLWTSEWKEYTVDMSNYVGQSIYVAFHQTGEADWIYLDNVKGVSLKGNTNCDNPTNLVLSNLSSNEATFTWNGDAAEYQYLLVEEGEEADWSAATKIAAKSVTLKDLYEETNYVFYVRSYCSESEQSLAPKLAFKTPCAVFSIPWIETFTRDLTGAVEPDCWTVSSATPQVWVVADKTIDENQNTITNYGQAHLYASGGGSVPQVFAMPMFNAPLNTLEVAFDYKTATVGEAYASLEVGYMTNPSKASTFKSLKTLPQTLNYQHAIVTLEDLPADAKFLAFRFAGGTSNYCGVSMDNFVVAEIGKSKDVDLSDEQVADAGIYALSYCQAQFMWYSYDNEAFAIGLFEDEGKQLVAGVVVTTGECDRFAYQDKNTGEFSGFSEDDDYENHYYCSTKWMLNADDANGGLAKGAAWADHVINVGSATSPLLGLKPGKYIIQIYPYSTTTGQGALMETIPFELVAKEVSDLKAEVAADKKSATLTWTAPEFGQGERLYVSVWSGETVAYDNLGTKERPASPLTVEVEEGKSYNATVQVVDKNNNPLGEAQRVSFTVGENNYEPKNPHAEVFGGDNVTFSWEATTAADRYVITLYCDGEFYSTLTVNGTTKTTTMPKDGTWSWTVQAFNQGSNGNYFEASNAIAGNDFVSKAADVPEDAIVLDVIGMNAYYIEPNTQWYQEGKNSWILQFGLGTEGYNYAWFLAYTNSPLALSGMYNTVRGNLDSESIAIFPLSGSEIVGTEADVRLQFDGFEEEEVSSGYTVTQAYYTGSFRMVDQDGKTYVGKFMELKCSSGDFANYYNGNPSNHITLSDEDPDYEPYQGIENLVVTSDKAEKVLHEGVLYIVRPNGAIYNATGVRVK